MKNDIGKRKWHRVFKWGTITHPYTDDGKTLFDSDHKHIENYVIGKGWVTYKGVNGGNISSIFLHKSELFNNEQKDEEQTFIDSFNLKIIS